MSNSTDQTALGFSGRMNYGDVLEAELRVELLDVGFKIDREVASDLLNPLLNQPHANPVHLLWPGDSAALVMQLWSCKSKTEGLHIRHV